MTRAEFQKAYNVYLHHFMNRCVIDGRPSAVGRRVWQDGDKYFRTQALGVWQSYAGFHSHIEEYEEFYNAIVVRHLSDGPRFTQDEMPVGQVEGQELGVVPSFLKTAMEFDDYYGTQWAQECITCVKQVLFLFASLDREEEHYEAKKAHVLARADRLKAAAALPALQKELHELIGLESVKGEVNGLLSAARVRQLRTAAGLPIVPMSRHLIFVGNPGTGKTTVARLIAQLYHGMGILSKGQLVEVDRSGLVSNYVGQTADKTQKVIDSAMGGVLFIDEAYALARDKSDNDYGREAIEVLLKNMEDHRQCH